MFIKEINFTQEQLDDFYKTLRKQQERLFFPAIAIAEKRQVLIDEEYTELLYELKLQEPKIFAETNLLNKVKADYFDVKTKKDSIKKVKSTLVLSSLSIKVLMLNWGKQKEIL